MGKNIPFQKFVLNVSYIQSVQAPKAHEATLVPCTYILAVCVMTG
jgi:hypothetical protein